MKKLLLLVLLAVVVAVDRSGAQAAHVHKPDPSIEIGGVHWTFYLTSEDRSVASYVLDIQQSGTNAITGVIRNTGPRS